MSQHRGLLTPEERARIMQLQDLLIDRFVEHREAMAAGQEERVKIVEAEIDGLLAERVKSRNGRLWARPSRPTEWIGYTVGDPALAKYGHRIGGIDRPASETAVRSTGVLSRRNFESRRSVRNHEIAAIIGATDPESHGRGYPYYSSGSLPPSNASVVSPNIIMLTVQSLPFISTTKPSYSAFTFENLLIANAMRRETFILLSVIRLT